RSGGAGARGGGRRGQPAHLAGELALRLEAPPAPRPVRPPRGPLPLLPAEQHGRPRRGGRARRRGHARRRVGRRGGGRGGGGGGRAGGGGGGGARGGGGGPARLFAGLDVPEDLELRV